MRGGRIAWPVLLGVASLKNPIDKYRFYVYYEHILITEEYMPRPRKRRRIGQSPISTMYKPQGVPVTALKGVALPLEGLEALRLVDAQGLDQEAAAQQMGVSRATLGRILAHARTTVATALSSGWAIRIEEGDDASAMPPCMQDGAGDTNRQRCAAPLQQVVKMKQ